MNCIDKFFNCGRHLTTILATEIAEIRSVVAGLPWQPTFALTTGGKTLQHQAAYNKALSMDLVARGWTPQPRLLSSPRLIGDFQKGLVFVEVQFGNSATLYRDYYKFQYGLANGLLSLAVLIVPEDPLAFFPTRNAQSVGNMADFPLADRCLSVLPINVPTWLIGLKP